MLGLEYTKSQINKEDSRKIMESLKRAISGNLTDEEKNVEEKFDAAAAQYHFE